MYQTPKGLHVWNQLQDQFAHLLLAQNWERIDTLLGTGVPLKSMVVYWIDAANEALPAGWAYCDGRVLTSAQQDINPGGTYTTPDMRNLFALGADPAKTVGQGAAGVGDGNINTVAGAPGSRAVGGGNQTTLVEANVPDHSHSVTLTTSSHLGHSHTNEGMTVSISSAGDHTHTLHDPGHTHTYQRQESGVTLKWRMDAVFSGGYDNIQDWIINPAQTGIWLDSAGAHTHTATLTGGVGMGGVHSHTASGLTSAVGSGTAFENRPRYVGVVWIMKVKT